MPYLGGFQRQYSSARDTPECRPIPAVSQQQYFPTQCVKFRYRFLPFGLCHLFFRFRFKSLAPDGKPQAF
jgi:hypothetical protein